ncbi:hypothetical protein D3C76_787910 [compost metagenome]
MPTGMAQMAQRSGVDSGDRAVAHHRVEHPQDCFRLADKQRFITQIDKRTAQLKFVINRARFFIGSQCQDRFVEQLQQHLIEFRHAASHAEEILHHVLNRLVTFPAVVQALGDAELAVKQQAVVIAGDFQMQCKTDAPQQMQTFVQFVAFGFG